MEYGLIGYPLKHSFSKTVHSLIADYDYSLCELSDSEVEPFIKGKNFKGINVTIPYKKRVMPYLNYIDENAKNIDAVNTISNIDGKLYGFNTDILGVLATFKRFNIDVSNKNVLILGTGATSNTVEYALKIANASKNYKAYRDGSKIKGDILYSDIKSIADSVQVIINTTSNGMYPNLKDDPLINLSDFNKLESIMDVVYNPLKTKLLIEASNLNIPYASGLYMLVAQAVFANILWSEKCTKIDNKNYFDMIDKKLDLVSSVYNKILLNKQNIVLIGMPSCGKSTVGRLLSDKLSHEFIDTDELITNEINCPIADYINKYGEEKFREVETTVVNDISNKNNLIISTGGGTILKKQNVDMLKANGTLFFINRSLSLLKATKDRPLTSDFESLKKKYDERLPIYNKVCDIEINGDLELDEKIDLILKHLNS